METETGLEHHKTTGADEIILIENEPESPVKNPYELREEDFESPMPVVVVDLSEDASNGNNVTTRVYENKTMESAGIELHKEESKSIERPTEETSVQDESRFVN